MLGFGRVGVERCTMNSLRAAEEPSWPLKGAARMLAEIEVLSGATFKCSGADASFWASRGRVTHVAAATTVTPDEDDHVLRRFNHLGL
jgi:hypothetical protein